MELKEAVKITLDAGFSHAAALNPSTIHLMDEVRDMCAQNTCGQYGRNWACPPACGELETLRQQVRAFHEGVLVQTVGDVEDSLDFEAMAALETTHKEHFHAAAKELKVHYPGLLALGAGCCTICKECAFPDNPCRFPEQKISSMEAYGILVSDLCRANGLAYYYGPGKIAYTSCYLLC